MRCLHVVLVPLISSCWVAVKTPLVAQYERLDEMSLLDATQDNIELAIGTPQAVGARQTPDGEQPAAFYQGMIGRVSLTGSMKVDAGIVFVSYKDRTVDQLFYARSEQGGPTIRMGGPLPVSDLADRFTLGESPVAEVIESLGEPAFRGRRVNKTAGIQNNIIWYERSRQPSSAGPLAERLLLVGYDEQGITQDLFWISSFPEDLKALGEVQPQNFKRLSRLDIGSWTGWTAAGVSTDTAIDPVQVDALLRTHPTTVEDIVIILGKPTGRGIKAFQEHDPLLVSSWTATKSEVVGRESLTVPTKPGVATPMPISYVVMSVSQSRLIVAHTPEGRIMEILWFAPRATP